MVYSCGIYPVVYSVKRASVKQFYLFYRTKYDSSYKHSPVADFL